MLARRLVGDVVVTDGFAGATAVVGVRATVGGAPAHVGPGIVVGDAGAFAAVIAAAANIAAAASSIVPAAIVSAAAAIAPLAAANVAATFLLVIAAVHVVVVRLVIGAPYSSSSASPSSSSSASSFSSSELKSGSEFGGRRERRRRSGGRSPHRATTGKLATQLGSQPWQVFFLVREAEEADEVELWWRRSRTTCIYTCGRLASRI